MTKVDKDSNVPCKDMIDRQAAIDGICKRCEELYHEYKCDGECDDIRFLKELPSAHPELDCILKQFGDCTYNETGCSDCKVKAKISAALSVQPEPKWIPCSERLPEKYGNYLISIHGEDEPDIGTISPNDKRGWSLCDANGFHWASDKKLIVTAWMPLPEKYREEGEQE